MKENFNLRQADVDYKVLKRLQHFKALAEKLLYGVGTATNTFYGELINTPPFTSLHSLPGRIHGCQVNAVCFQLVCENQIGGVYFQCFSDFPFQLPGNPDRLWKKHLECPQTILVVLLTSTSVSKTTFNYLDKHRPDGSVNKVILQMHNNGQVGLPARWNHHRVPMNS